MKCENIFCVYQKDGICKLEKVDIDNAGMCAQCIYIEIDDEILAKKKVNMSNKF